MLLQELCLGVEYPFSSPNTSGSLGIKSSVGTRLRDDAPVDTAASFQRHVAASKSLLSPPAKTCANSLNHFQRTFYSNPASIRSLHELLLDYFKVSSEKRDSVNK